MPVSRRLRFEILRRDNHACRYCGQMAPEVRLTVDHVVPVALGGSDEATNLVTACMECNSGKSATSPDEHHVADVEQDALRWRAAMMRAQAAAMDDYAQRDEWLTRFRSLWDNWTVNGEPLQLPANWRMAVASYRNVGLMWRDFSDAIERAMTARHVDDEFAYMLAVLRNKHAERVAVARALLDAEATQGDTA